MRSLKVQLLSLIEQGRGTEFFAESTSPPPIIGRNAAFDLAKLGSGDPEHRKILLEGLSDRDLSVRAACRWTLHQMAIAVNDPAAKHREWFIAARALSK